MSPMLVLRLFITVALLLATALLFGLASEHSQLPWWLLFAGVSSCFLHFLIGQILFFGIMILTQYYGAQFRAGRVSRSQCEDIFGRLNDSWWSEHFLDTYTSLLVWLGLVLSVAGGIWLAVT